MAMTAEWAASLSLCYLLSVQLLLLLQVVLLSLPTGWTAYGGLFRSCADDDPGCSAFYDRDALEAVRGLMTGGAVTQALGVLVETVAVWSVGRRYGCSHRVEMMARLLTFLGAAISIVGALVLVAEDEESTALEPTQTEHLYNKSRGQGVTGSVAGPPANDPGIQVVVASFAVLGHDDGQEVETVVEEKVEDRYLLYLVTVVDGVTALASTFMVACLSQHVLSERLERLLGFRVRDVRRKRAEKVLALRSAVRAFLLRVCGLRGRSNERRGRSLTMDDTTLLSQNQNSPGVASSPASSGSPSSDPARLGIEVNPERKPLRRTARLTSVLEPNVHELDLDLSDFDFDLGNSLDEEVLAAELEWQITQLETFASTRKQQLLEQDDTQLRQQRDPEPHDKRRQDQLSPDAIDILPFVPGLRRPRQTNPDGREPSPEEYKVKFRERQAVSKKGTKLKEEVVNVEHMAPHGPVHLVPWTYYHQHPRACGSEGAVLVHKVVCQADVHPVPRGDVTILGTSSPASSSTASSPDLPRATRMPTNSSLASLSHGSPSIRPDLSRALPMQPDNSPVPGYDATAVTEPASLGICSRVNSPDFQRESPSNPNGSPLCGSDVPAVRLSSSPSIGSSLSIPDVTPTATIQPASSRSSGSDVITGTEALSPSNGSPNSSVSLQPDAACLSEDGLTNVKVTSSRENEAARPSVAGLIQVVQVDKVDDGISSLTEEEQAALSVGLGRIGAALTAADAASVVDNACASASASGSLLPTRSLISPDSAPGLDKPTT